MDDKLIAVADEELDGPYSDKKMLAKVGRLIELASANIPPPSVTEPGWAACREAAERRGRLFAEMDRLLEG